MKSIVDQQYWDNAYKKFELKYDDNQVLFKEIFHKFLPNRGSCIEIGCYPGLILMYLGKNFDYEISGIDKTPYIKKLPKFFSENGVENYHFHQADFIDFVSEDKYDVVCSFGFIEHFEIYEDIIKRHISLLHESGICIIASPNLRKIQFFLHKIFDKKNLERHVIDSMDLKKWREILEENNMEILFCGYYETCGFWADSEEKNFFSKFLIKFLQISFSYINRIVNKPNSLISPYMICVSKKIIQSNKI